MSNVLEKSDDGRTVMLRRMRLSFTDALKDKKRTSEESDKLSHTCNAINEKSGKFYDENQAKIVSALQAAGVVQWKNEGAYKSIREDSPKRVCARPGVSFKNREGKVYEGYEGNFAITGKGPGAGDRRPELIDRGKRVLREQATPEFIKAGRVFDVGDILSIFYPGTYADVWVSFYGTDKGSRGIFCSIERIRSYQEGERMAGGRPDLDDIDELEDLDDGDSFGGSPAAAPSDDDW